MLTNIRLLDEIYQKLDSMAKSVPKGSEGLIFTPWLYGERTPVENHTVRGGFQGPGFNASAKSGAPKTKKKKRCQHRPLPEFILCLVMVECVPCRDVAFIGVDKISKLTIWLCIE